MTSRNIGQKAEVSACQFLQTKGLRLLERNYNCIFGELDLIMRDKDDIVFVEVRKRDNADFATALESISPPKRKKIIKSAAHFLQKMNWYDKVPCRFDVIAIHLDQIEWIKNAFYVE